MKSPSQHQFSQVPSIQTTRSRFNRSSGLKTTFDASYLIPVFLDEVLPGDTFSVRMTHFARLATPVKPIMDNMYLDSFFFFVPNRLVWEHWVNMMGEQDNPDDTVDFTVPQMQAPASTGYAIHSLADYFGLPTGIPNFKHSALPFRAYNLIWNQWFRPQDICDSVHLDKGDADSSPANYVLLQRAKRHDYFTSCLPFPQKGEDVLLPLGDSAPVLGIGKQSNTFAEGSQTVWQADGSHATYPTSANVDGANANRSFFVQEGTVSGHAVPAIYADLHNATAATINSLREAFQLQRMLERDARSGTRYVEALRARFGVTSPDFRLQRPEYLGGGSTRINTTPIAQQSATGTTGTPQGNLAAMGTSSGQHGFSKSFTEHGFVIGLVSVRADLTYQQGLHRMWSRLTRFDHYEPVLANLGEQQVLTKELYCQAPTVDTGSTGTPDNEKIFGYQERWAEYRYKPSQVTGLFRSQAAGSLAIWHLAQQFTSMPTLDPTFLLENVPLDRDIAVPSEPHFLFDALIENTTVRPMPVYSIPGMIDHH